MLPVPYAAQINDSACLPACAQMVLAYYGRKVSQTQLIRLLGTTDAGTPFSRLPLLSQLVQNQATFSVASTSRGPPRSPGHFSLIPIRLSATALGAAVDLGTNGTLAELQATLPVIVALHAGWLPGHIVESQHAVVVIGIDPEGILILDPAQGADPILLSENEFLTAWIEMDCVFGVVSS
jgi:ABC-type bacteriocin/lantibiotic exporter with double-glycine peptidase domain